MANNEIEIVEVQAKAKFDDRQVGQALQASINRNAPSIIAVTKTTQVLENMQHLTGMDERLPPQAYYQGTIWEEATKLIELGKLGLDINNLAKGSPQGFVLTAIPALMNLLEQINFDNFVTQMNATQSGVKGNRLLQGLYEEWLELDAKPNKNMYDRMHLDEAKAVILGNYLREFGNNPGATYQDNVPDQVKETLKWRAGDLIQGQERNLQELNRAAESKLPHLYDMLEYYDSELQSWVKERDEYLEAKAELVAKEAGISPL